MKNDLLYNSDRYNQKGQKIYLNSPVKTFYNMP